MTSPTQRTLKYLRDLGYTCQVVERWNPHAKVRQDLFGFIDIVSMVAAGDKRGITGIQATSGTNHAARREKILANPLAQTWREAGGGIAIISWSKTGARGKVKHWTPRIELL